MRAHGFLTAVLPVAALAVQPPAEPPPDRGNSAAAYRLAQAAAAEYDIHVAGDDRPLELLREPVLHWSNPVVGEVHGNVYLWVRDGRPQVVASLHKWFTPKTDMDHEFLSLAEGPLRSESRTAANWATSAGLMSRPNGCAASARRSQSSSAAWNRSWTACLPGLSIHPRFRPLMRMRCGRTARATFRISVARAPLEAE